MSAATWCAAAAAALVVLGLAGLAIRRNLLASAMSGIVSLLGAVLGLCAVAHVQSDVDAVSAAALLLVACSALSLLGVSVAVAAYRSRGATRIDELSELGGSS